MRKVEVPTDTPTEFELRDTAADIERREDREGKTKKQQREEREREEAKKAETPQSHKENRVAEKRPRTERTDRKWTQIKTVLSPFLWPRQGPPEQSSPVYLKSEVEVLEERNCQTFRNDAVKLLSGNQSRPEVRTHQPSNLHFLGGPVSLPHTSIQYVPQTF